MKFREFQSIPGRPYDSLRVEVPTRTVNIRRNI